MAVLIAVWFASGAVLMFADYPAFTDAERLEHAAALGDARRLELPPQLRAWLAGGGLRSGARARLVRVEQRLTWVFTDGGQRVAERAERPFDVAPLDATRARAEVERLFGRCRGEASEVDVPDQWTVGRSEPGSYPLRRIACDDASRREVYVSARSGEVVQESTRSERIGAWLGPIPHWIYPAALRRERVLWCNAPLPARPLALRADMRLAVSLTA